MPSALSKRTNSFYRILARHLLDQSITTVVVHAPNTWLIRGLRRSPHLPTSIVQLILFLVKILNTLL